jgi:response regulator RpfG family c-di-GMP phosphodiesterase/tRNA A-37 threonylcarbamoyl transferase component Bud32
MTPLIDYAPPNAGPVVAPSGGTMEAAIPPAQSLLARLLNSQVLLTEEWDEVPPTDRDALTRLVSTEALLAKLLNLHLLTRFQVETIRKGGADDLILGNYRVLDVLGQGAMGTVYRAEHFQLRRQVALKMARSTDVSARLIHRFYAEARAVARLQHPHIVTCFDAGRHTKGGGPPRDYFVMELIPGQDLFTHVRERGPLSPLKACDLFRQVADALGEAHRTGLIHRDIKPSNVLVTPDGQAKVLDFGLARLPTQQMTEPGVVLGTIGYMAPEQARDPHNVDARADLFSLGATLYWALTGRDPYPVTGNPVQDLHRRFTTTPPPVRRVRPEVPAEVSDLVARLMEPDPELRFPSARTVSAALTGFTLWLPHGTMVAASASRLIDSTRGRVLVVEDDPSVRALMMALLQDQYDVREAEDGESGLAEVLRDPPDLVVVDVGLPGLSGPDLIEKVRAAGLESDRLKVLLTSGELPAEALGGLSVSAADDFISKPFAPVEFLSRTRALLMRRPAKSHDLAGTTTPPPATGTARPVAAEALSLTISRLLAETQLISEGQWTRVARYVRALAHAVPEQGEYARLKDEHFVAVLSAVAPVYDIGLLGVPRHTLLKPDRLDAAERSIVQTHCAIGAEVLIGVAQTFGGDVPGLDVAAEVARCHHENWDGSGYPDGLVGEDIPLAARVVALAAVYEALRSRRPHRPPLSHAQATRLIAQDSPGQFDPTLVTAFVSVANRFDQIHLGQ